MTNESAQIGLGTHISHASIATLIQAALEYGCKIIDTAPNYIEGRAQRALGELSRSGLIGSARILTKVGFLPNSQVLNKLLQSGIIKIGDVKGKHILSPAYIDYQVRVNAAELDRTPLDMLFLHNPEAQFGAQGNREDFLALLKRAFETCEALCDAGIIKAYGISTWSNLLEKFSLYEIDALAWQLAGNRHRFKAIQLPISLIRIEAVRGVLEGVGPLVVAHELGIETYASAPLHSGQLPKIVSPELAHQIDEGLSIAQACIQFVRSVPHLSVVLFSASSVSQMEEIFDLQAIPVLPRRRIENVIKLVG